MKHNYEQRRQQRIDNALTQAEKQKAISEQRNEAANKMASVIPMGQPILVGHYSEKADRNYRARINNNYAKSVEADEKAKYYEEKAASIAANTAISSDDPEAIAKLKHKLAGLEKEQVFMKEANKLIKKKDREAFLKLEGATLSLWEERSISDYGVVGYARYELALNGAEIRRVKQRIIQLEKDAQRVYKEETIKGVLVRHNVEANRLQLLFPAKPDEATRELLYTRYRFYWCRTEGVWQRMLNGNGLWAAREFFKQYEEPGTTSAEGGTAA